MANDLVIRKATSLALNSLEEVSSIAQHFVNSGYFKDSKSLSQAVVKILAGRELGLSPFASMRGIFLNSQGNLGMTANVMAAVIKKSKSTMGYDFRVKKDKDGKFLLSNDGCTLEFLQNGEVIGESKFDKEDAKQADLLTGANAHNYKKYARNMYWSRALTNGAKWFCSEVFTGVPIYTPDEIGGVVDGETFEVVQPSTPTEVDAEVVGVKESEENYREKTRQLLKELNLPIEQFCKDFNLEPKVLQKLNDSDFRNLYNQLVARKELVNA